VQCLIEVFVDQTIAYLPLSHGLECAKKIPNENTFDKKIPQSQIINGHRPYANNNSSSFNMALKSHTPLYIVSLSVYSFLSSMR